MDAWLCAAEPGLRVGLPGDVEYGLSPLEGNHRERACERAHLPALARG